MEERDTRQRRGTENLFSPVRGPFLIRASAPLARFLWLLM